MWGWGEFVVIGGELGSASHAPLCPEINLIEPAYPPPSDVGINR